MPPLEGARRRAGDLRAILDRIDGRGYRAYQEIEGSYDCGSFDLFIDRAQPDPFAHPSRLRVRVAWNAAGFPEELLTNRARRIAAEDFLARGFRRALGRHAGTDMRIEAGGQEVLERSALRVTSQWIEARFTAELPAAGRRIQGREARRRLLEALPHVVEDSLFYRSHDREAFRLHLDVVEDQQVLRRTLAQMRLVAFVADGSILPRRSGVDERPLSPEDIRPPVELIPFTSPPELRTSIVLPHRGEVRGMGIRAGVTLIVGGGFHGKSTLLAAVERGVYDHIPGDGRELVVSLAGSVKIRAESGRRIEKTDISPFISNLPFGQDTTRFSTENASGSTSQAANIMEALELGAPVLLMDEDTSATNFMIRDARMQTLVAREREPITPYLDRVRQLYEEHGVSTILVMGGSGDYLDVADTVILMDRYCPHDVTPEARQVASLVSQRRQPEGRGPFGRLPARRPVRASLDARRGRSEAKVSLRGPRALLYGETVLELSALETLVEPCQSRAIGLALDYFARNLAGPGVHLRQGLEELDRRLDLEGLDLLSPAKVVGNLARPRLFEIGAALNRLRTLLVTDD